MSNAIAELWDGQLYPVQRCGERSASLCRLNGEMASRMAELRQRLDGVQQELLDAYIDSACEYIDLLAKEAFSDGYALATEMMMESRHRAQVMME